MADRLYLSYWLRGLSATNLFEPWEKLLRNFPFSEPQCHATLRVYAFELVEPPVAEAECILPDELERVLQVCREHAEPDYAWEVEATWDLWHWDNTWSSQPTNVRLLLFGPLFESDWGEQLRIEFGPDIYFLPPDGPCSTLAPLAKNIRKLLDLSSKLDQVLAVEKRLLWSESEENFAVKLEEMLRQIEGKV